MAVWGRSRSRSRNFFYGGYGGFAPYVSAAERRLQAMRQVAALKKQGRVLAPVTITKRGRAIAATFWGKAWCDDIESHSDWANRLPRGRTYVRGGSVLDLQISAGKITALVQGSDLYTVTISIARLAPAKWKRIASACTGKIGSLVALLKGRLSDDVMQLLTAPKTGIFPTPKEMTFDCTCPDYASMCKHVAASLYGVGARLDDAPALLFTLRDVDQAELVTKALEAPARKRTQGKGRVLAEKSLGEVFGIELASGSVPMHAKMRSRR